MSTHTADPRDEVRPCPGCIDCVTCCEPCQLKVLGNPECAGTGQLRRPDAERVIEVQPVEDRYVWYNGMAWGAADTHEAALLAARAAWWGLSVAKAPRGGWYYGEEACPDEGGVGPYPTPDAALAAAIDARTPDAP